MRRLIRRFSTTDFGNKEVPIAEKQNLVNQVFSSVANNYDLMNDLMSMGVHRWWKDEFLTDMGTFDSSTPLAFLDVAGGTGDIAFRVLEKYRKEVPSYSTLRNSLKITVSDINSEMLEVGKQRALEKGYEMDWVEANAEELPFEDDTFDYYTIAFGIRNVPDRLKALKEAYRVLKKGGRFMCLEFSKVEYPGLDNAYSLYSHYYIPTLGQLVAGDKDSYQYLVESIEKFPSQDEFADLIHKAGFEYVNHRNLTFGVVAIHSGVKLT